MRHNQGMPLGTSRQTRQTLDNFLNEKGFNKGVEIGVWRGDHAKLLLETIKDIELTCIDPWEGYKWHSVEEQERYYQDTIRNLAPYKVTILKMFSLDALDKFEDRSLDFVHIDGNHDFDYCVTDIIFWSKKVKSGGIIAVHDYDSHMTGVMRAVDSYTHCHSINPWFVIREQGHPFTAFWVNP